MKWTEQSECFVHASSFTSKPAWERESTSGSGTLWGTVIGVGRPHELHLGIRVWKGKYACRPTWSYKKYYPYIIVSNYLILLTVQHNQGSHVHSLHNQGIKIAAELRAQDANKKPRCYTYFVPNGASVTTKGLLKPIASKTYYTKWGDEMILNMTILSEFAVSSTHIMFHVSCFSGRNTLNW